jgi:hypothetical protein
MTNTTITFEGKEFQYISYPNKYGYANSTYNTNQYRIKESDLNLKFNEYYRNGKIKNVSISSVGKFHLKLKDGLTTNEYLKMYLDLFNHFAN